MWDSIPVSELVALGLDVGVFLLFRAVLRRHEQILRDIKSAPRFASYDELESALVEKRTGHDLIEGDCEGLPYAVVEGRVYPLGDPIVSQFLPGESGVIKKFAIKDLKMERHNGLWQQKTDNIQDHIRSVPFKIVFGKDLRMESAGLLRVASANTPAGVEFLDLDKIDNPLDGELDVVYDRYEPSTTGFGKAFFDSVRGDVSKGIQETEKMLLIGTKVTALGKLLANRSDLKMLCPSSRYEFILTRKSYDEIVRGYQDATGMIRAFTYLVGAIGVFLSVVITRRVYKELIERREYSVLLGQLSERRRSSMSMERTTSLESDAVAVVENRNDDDASPVQDCIICMTNRRDVILLGCGHVCVCHECARLLPCNRCPVCRTYINRVQSFYIA